MNTYTKNLQLIGYENMPTIKLIQVKKTGTIIYTIDNFYIQNIKQAVQYMNDQKNQ